MSWVVANDFHSTAAIELDIMFLRRFRWSAEKKKKKKVESSDSSNRMTSTARRTNVNVFGFLRAIKVDLEHFKHTLNHALPNINVQHDNTFITTTNMSGLVALDGR
jgi:uncharacterized protein (DUF2132 family)